MTIQSISLHKKASKPTKALARVDFASEGHKRRDESSEEGERAAKYYATLNLMLTFFLNTGTLIPSYQVSSLSHLDFKLASAWGRCCLTSH